ncbi:Speckle-type POZ protein-like [Halotydeus destructor]|nr:Speckle-type POZ protein-like [Halotydeus destructor]
MYAICFFDSPGHSTRYQGLKFSVKCPTKYETKETCKSTVHIEHLEYMLDNFEFCDVKLIADDGHMAANKGILASQSTVFRTMFAFDCREKREKEVRLEQVTISVLRAVVRFIYLDQIEFQDHVFAFEICIVADRLGMTSLVQLSQDYLVTQLTEDNVVVLLLSAKNFTMEKLEQECILFIGKLIRIKHASVVVDFDLIASPSLLIRIIAVAESSDKPCDCVYHCLLGAHSK